MPPGRFPKTYLRSNSPLHVVPLSKSLPIFQAFGPTSSHTSSFVPDSRSPLVVILTARLRIGSSGDAAEIGRLPERRLPDIRADGTPGHDTDDIKGFGRRTWAIALRRENPETSMSSAATTTNRRISLQRLFRKSPGAKKEFKIYHD